MSKCEDPECGFKRLVSAAKYHQTEVREGTPDEKNDYDDQRQQNDHCGANSHANHRCKAVVMAIREKAKRLETEREQKGGLDNG